MVVVCFRAGSDVVPAGAAVTSRPLGVGAGCGAGIGGVFLDVAVSAIWKSVIVGEMGGARGPRRPLRIPGPLRLPRLIGCWLAFRSEGFRSVLFEA